MKAECPECGWSKEMSDKAKWEGKEGERPECGVVFKKLLTQSRWIRLKGTGKRFRQPVNVERTQGTKFCDYLSG